MASRTAAAVVASKTLSVHYTKKKTELSEGHCKDSVRSNKHGLAKSLALIFHYTLDTWHVTTRQTLVIDKSLQAALDNKTRDPPGPSRHHQQIAPTV